MKRALLKPAGSLRTCGLLVLAAALLLPAVALIVGSKGIFLLVAVPTMLGALLAIYLASKAGARPVGPFKPTILVALLYSAGVIACVAGYAYLALTNSSIVAAREEVIYWELVDKRPLVFAYLVVVALVVFHWFMVGCFLDARPADRLAAGIDRPANSRAQLLLRWTTKGLGGVLVAVLAYWWIALPALRAVSTGAQYRSPGNKQGLADFFDLHAHVHLGALEQIRLGATPYLEAETQYGLGNQVLMYFLVNAISFSNHGFFAANILLNVVCVIGFFVVLQQFVGFGWAVAGLIGWVLLPSPYSIIDFAGWAILTRWLAIPVLSLLVAYLMLNARPKSRNWMGPLLAGAIWGAGGFLSQENLSGGFLVLAFSLALFGPASGMPLRALARFAALFVASGAVMFVALVAGIVGVSHSLEVLRLGNVKAGLVMAGLSNSFWADDPAVFRPLLQTYGFAVLLMVAVALLAGFLGRSWFTATEKDRQFVWKFAGVAVGAYVLHLFTLMRSDVSHLSGPSILLPLFLVMLPLFIWRCVKPGAMRGALLVVSVGLLLEAAIAGRSEIARKLDEVRTAWSDSTEVLRTYDTLRASRDKGSDLATRYSPLPRFQPAFRNHRDFGETRELFELLRDRLQGRQVEIGFHKLNELIDHREVFYFFGGFRSISGLTSPTSSIWLRSEENAWIDKVVNTRAACVFFEPNGDSKLLAAWQKSVRPPDKVVSEPIAGKRLYGILSCKT